MDEQVVKAQSEIAAVEQPPKSLDEVISTLRGFGVEEFEEILTIKTKRRDVHLRISNLSTSDEMTAVIAAEEHQGYLWMKQVKVELISRAISWLDGISLRDLTPAQRLVADPTDNGVQKDIQVVLRNLLLSWGQETTEVLWKVVMTHSQRIEDMMRQQFPDSAVMTDVEQRLFEQARKQVEAETKVIIEDQVAQYESEAAQDKE
jgi:hypothetical protein